MVVNNLNNWTFSKCIQAIWETPHISQYLPLWFCITPKQRVLILFHNRVTPWPPVETLAEWDASLYFFLRRRILFENNMPLEREKGEWAGNSDGGHTKCGNNTMYLCPFLLPPTTNTTLNPSSIWANPQCLSSSCYADKMSAKRKITSIPECSIWSMAKSKSMTSSTVVVVVVAEARYYYYYYYGFQ